MEIRNYEWFEMDLDGEAVYGLDQTWYPSKFQKTAGCGPTTAASLLLYINRKENGPLQYCNHDIESAVLMLNDVWNYVKPGRLGLFRTKKFTRGLHRLFEYHGLSWKCHELRVKKGTPASKVVSFVEEGIRSDSPVAFLNLHAGEADAFEDWHWIVLTGIRRERDTRGKEINVATGLDGGKKIEFNMDNWVATTKWGGGFVYITA